MAHAALLLLGLAVALLGPRHRPVLLTLLTGALAAGVCTGLVFAGQLPLWGAALVFGLLALVVVLLPHFLPRGLLGLLFLVLLATLVPIARLPDLPRPATITLAALLLAGVVLGLLRAPDRSLRVACALLGARLMSQAFPTTEWWAPLVAVGVLLALDAALRSGPWPVPVPPASTRCSAPRGRCGLRPGPRSRSPR